MAVRSEHKLGHSLSKPVPQECHTIGDLVLTPRFVVLSNSYTAERLWCLLLIVILELSSTPPQVFLPPGSRCFCFDIFSLTESFLVKKNVGQLIMVTLFSCNNSFYQSPLSPWAALADYFQGHFRTVRSDHHWTRLLHLMIDQKTIGLFWIRWI